MTIIIDLVKIVLAVKLVFWMLKHAWNFEALKYKVMKNPACKVVGGLDACIFIYSFASKDGEEREIIIKYHEKLYNKFIESGTMISQSVTAIVAIDFLIGNDLSM